MSSIEAILFDKDGTLFDEHRTWASWTRALLDDLAGGDAALARRLGDAVGFEIDFNTFRPGSMGLVDVPHEFAHAILPHLPGASLAGIVTRMAALSSRVRRIEATPLVPLLDDLMRRGLRLGVVTNDLEKPARSQLRDAGVEPVFDAIIAGDTGFAAKPAPDMLLAFCEMTGVVPNAVCMVGDSLPDMVAARAAGTRRLAVLTGTTCRARLEPLAEAVLPSVAALPRWLDTDRAGQCAA